MSSNDSDDHGSSHAKASDRSRSDRKEYSRGSDFERSKNRERDRGGREKDRDRYRGRDKFDDYDSHGRGGRGRNTERHSDYGRDRDRRYRNRSPSPSKERLRQRSRSPSPSKSKRKSGFDMAPAVGGMLPNAAVGGMLPNAAVAGVPQTMPGLVQNFMSFGTPQVGALSLMPAQAMTQQATRHARRVYVGGLPPTANEQTIATFFSRIMATIGGNSAGPGDAVVNVYINHEKKFAFVEMRTVEEASNAMALDGVIFEGIAVRVRRPTDYNPSLAATLGPSQPNPNLNLAAIGLSPGTMGGVEGPDRVFVGGLPYYFNEMQIRELLESFGPLHGFDLVKDRETGNSKGYGFCVYKDPAVTDIACAALNGLKMGDKTLTVRRATASGQPKSEQENILAQAQHDIAIQKMVLQAGGMSIPGGADTSRILCLSEAITIDVLEDDDEYQEILEDMQEECGKFGTLIRVVIPRPTQTGEPIPGAGKVFLEYSDTMGSSNAKHALDGRKFGGNTVRAFYYPEDKYVNGDYDV